MLMEVRDKNIGDSKFGLPRFSSVEAVSIMETEYVYIYTKAVYVR